MDIREKTKRALVKNSGKNPNMFPSLDRPAVLIDCSSFLYQILFRGLMKKTAPVPTVRDLALQFLSTTLSLPYAFGGTYANVEYFWDSRRSLRKEEYADYKGQRKKSDDPRVIEGIRNMRKAMKRVKKALEKATFPSHRYSGFEADDLIAYRTEALVGNVIIASSDSDMWQLMVRDKRSYVACFSPMKQTLYTAEDFQNEYGFPAAHWCNVLSLSGCTTDNVKGIPGIGKMSAIEIVKGTYDLVKNREPSKKYHTLSAKMHKIPDCSIIAQRNRRLTKLPHEEVRRIEKPIDLSYTDGRLVVLLDIFPSLLNAEGLDETLRETMRRDQTMVVTLKKKRIKT